MYILAIVPSRLQQRRCLLLNFLFFRGQEAIAPILAFYKGRTDGGMGTSEKRDTQIPLLPPTFRPPSSCLYVLRSASHAKLCLLERKDRREGGRRTKEDKQVRTGSWEEGGKKEKGERWGREVYVSNEGCEKGRTREAKTRGGSGGPEGERSENRGSGSRGKGTGMRPD